MLERLLIKNYLAFDRVELDFDDGLIAFTGVSGAGKSILINGLLTLFGIKDTNAKLIEASLNAPLPILYDLGISEEEPNILTFLKEKKARYFINSQAVSKKNIYKACTKTVKYLSIYDKEEFSSENMINLLDCMICKHDLQHKKNITIFNTIYEDYIRVKEELDCILQEEKKIDELREFAKYEVQIIDKIDPKIGEDIELLEIKKTLSKKEKISQAISRASEIFELESSVFEMLNLCEIDSSFFDECMNDLRAYIDESSVKLEELEDTNIEDLLQRVEELSKLKSRFGDIEQALEYREKKLLELKRYENITYEKSELQSKFLILQNDIEDILEKLTKKRVNEIQKLEKLINSYLEKLYLKNIKIVLTNSKLSKQGIDKIEIKLNNLDIKHVSSGELNRIRLAFIATKNEIQNDDKKGVLILDEVDANLSGKEAMSVAKVLQEISKTYQVIAISHQPQLSSCANQHFLVEKIENKSSVRLLDEKERIHELARMVSGEKIEHEAIEFAKRLLEVDKDQN